MSQITNTPNTSSTPVIQTKISNLQLMTLVHRINSQIDLFLSRVSETKRDNVSIFKKESLGQKQQKIWEGAMVLSVALISGGTQAGAFFAQGFVQTALRAASTVLPQMSQGAQCLFSSYENLANTKKYLAQSDLDSARSTDEKLNKQISSNHDTLSQLLRQLGTLNQLR